MLQSGLPDEAETTKKPIMPHYKLKSATQPASKQAKTQPTKQTQLVPESDDLFKPSLQKKKVQDAKQAFIDQKQRKRDDKRKGKENAKNQPKTEQPPQQTAPTTSPLDSAELPVTKVHFKKSALKKTRSKRKNFKKDTRPEGEKQAKLGHKYVQLE